MWLQALQPLMVKLGFNLSQESEGIVSFEEGSQELALLDPQWIENTTEDRNSVKVLLIAADDSIRVVYIPNLVLTTMSPDYDPCKIVGNYSTDAKQRRLVFFKQAGRVGVTISPPHAEFHGWVDPIDYPPLEMSGTRREVIAERPGDMGEGTKLQVYREDDGDFIVSVMPIGHRIPDIQVQFCVPGSGGGASTRTWNALRELHEALQADARNNPKPC